MARKFYSGIQIVNLPAGSAPQAGAAIGVDSVGNVVVIDGGFKTALVANVVATATTDTAILSTTIPANGLFAGDVLGIRSRGTITFGTLTPVTFWIKIGTTKVLSVPINSGVGASTYTYTFDGLFTQRTVGASGGYAIGARLAVAATAAPVAFDADATSTLSTIVANVMTLGLTWTNAGGSCSTTQALIGAI